MNGSSGPGEWLTVVGEETGEVRIGSTPAAPAGIATVPVPGGTVYVDPACPDAPPTAVVADPDDAARALERLYGDEVAAAVAAGGQAVTVPVVATEAAARLTRLGILRWLGTSSPFPLDRGLLMLETAVAAVACGDVLTGDDETSPTLEDLGDALVALAWTVREGGTDALPVGLTDLLEDALNGLVLGLGPDDPLADTARHESELRDAMTALAIDRLDWNRWEQLVRQTRPEAVAQGGTLGPADGPILTHGTTSVDWMRVPVGLLDPGEGTVDWSVHRVDGERMRVAVSVRARGETSGEFMLADWLGRADGAAAATLRRFSGGAGEDPALRFRLYMPGFGLPLATGALTRSEDGTQWQGTVEVSERGVRGGDLFVDVHSAGTPGPQRDKQVAVEASRWAMRGLSLLRLSLAGAAAGDIRGPLERARQLYAEAGARTGGDDPAASLGLRRSVARCDALVVAHMMRSGAGHVVARRAMTMRQAELLPGDTEIPELSSPLWLPTVTERALLHGTTDADG